MSNEYTIETATESGALSAFARSISRAFTWPEELARQWVDAIDPGCVRIARDDGGAILGGLYLIPMGQFFGGRSVTHEGIAAVVVEPDMRGRGVAHRLLVHALREMRARGTALAGLYPASWQVYRKSGFELAGVRAEARLDLRRVDPIRGDVRPALRVRRADIDPRAPDGPDFERVRKVYASTAPRSAGRLDRSTYIWKHKILNYRNDDSEMFICEDDSGNPVGYLALARLRPSVSEPPTMHIRDLEALSDQSARALLSFLGGHRSSIVEAHWLTGPTHPVLLAMPDRLASMRILDHWMIRLVDIPNAITQRGYGAHARVDAVLDVHDDALDENNQAWRVGVELGRGVCEPAEESRDSGLPRVSVHARALGPLYTGFQSASMLQLAGMISGDPDAIAGLDAAFAGPMPWIGEMY